MKVDNAHIFWNDNIQKISNDKKLHASRGTKVPKTFTIPEQKEAFRVQKNREPVKTTADLKRVLSAEEKQLFELLFPSSPRVHASRPVKTYAVQQTHTKHPEASGRSHKNILGNHLDIRG